MQRTTLLEGKETVRRRFGEGQPVVRQRKTTITKKQSNEELQKQKRCRRQKCEEIELVLARKPRGLGEKHKHSKGALKRRELSGRRVCMHLLHSGQALCPYQTADSRLTLRPNRATPHPAMQKTWLEEMPGWSPALSWRSLRNRHPLASSQDFRYQEDDARDTYAATLISSDNTSSGPRMASDRRH
jgi:hypothetical protein